MSTFKVAVAVYVRDNLILPTRLGETPRALMRVRLNKTIRHTSEVELLHANLAVQHVNRRLWEDVNPLLADYVDELIEEERGRLRRRKVPEEDLEIRLLDALEPKD